MSEENSTDTVTLSIDGVDVTVPRGTKVIEAAKQAGKIIPHFCYHPGLPVDGNCRMCIADVRTWNERTGQHMHHDNDNDTPSHQLGEGFGERVQDV